MPASPVKRVVAVVAEQFVVVLGADALVVAAVEHLPQDAGDLRPALVRDVAGVAAAGRLAPVALAALLALLARAAAVDLLLLLWLLALASDGAPLVAGAALRVLSDRGCGKQEQGGDHEAAEAGQHKGEPNRWRATREPVSAEVVSAARAAVWRGRPDIGV